MNEEIIEISERLNQCFKCISATTSMYELAEFERYLDKEEALIPTSKKPAYTNNDLMALKYMRHRIELLKIMLKFPKL